MSLKQKLKAQIEQIPILTPAEVDLIVEQSIVKGFTKGDFLLEEGQIATQCYMVVEGCVREFFIKDGEEKTTAFYTEGDKITSYTSEGKGKPSRHFLECVEDAVLTISTDRFEDELRSLVPRLDAIIQQVAMQELSKAKDDWSSFTSSSPEERYKHLLEHRPSLLNRVPQHQVASYLGIKPESLSRIRKRIHENK